MKSLSLAVLAALTLGAINVAGAAPVKYNIDSDHTFPSFTADHMGGLSNWRGKFKNTTGTIVLDKDAKTGTVDITIDTNSLDFGHDKMTDHAKKDEKMFDVAKFPTATYKGKISKWGAKGPEEVTGDLTLHGVTKPVTLKISQFLCKDHPMRKKEVCGADASGTFNRADFGITYGQPLFKPEVKLQIQVEALIAT